MDLFTNRNDKNSEEMASDVYNIIFIIEKLHYQIKQW